MWLEKGNLRDPCGDVTVLVLWLGWIHEPTHVIKSYRTKYTPIHKGKIWGKWNKINSLYWCHYPSDIAQWEKLGKGSTVALHYVLTIACDSTVISKEKFD